MIEPARLVGEDVPPVPDPWTQNVFGALSALLVAGFYFLPDQAGRNLVLYLTALTAHGFLLRSGAWSQAFGHPGGWAFLALVGMPAASLLWSAGYGTDTVKDLLIAAYCLLAVYVGVARLLNRWAALTDGLAVLMVASGNVAGLAAIGFWAFSDAPAARLGGVWGIDNPVHASVLLLAGTLPVLWHVLCRRWVPFWLTVLVVPVVFVVLAGGRMAAAAYLMVVLAMVAVRAPRAVSWLAGAVVAVALLAVAVLGIDRITEIWLARGLSYRDVVWAQVWSAYRDCSALLGCGIGTPLSVSFAGVEGERAHSIFVAALYHQGLLGLAVFLGSLGWLVWRGLRSVAPGMRGWAWTLGFVLLANVTSGDHVLVRGSLFWPCFWIPVMVLAASARGTSRADPT